MANFDLSSLLSIDLRDSHCVMVVDNAAGHARRRRTARSKKNDPRFRVETKECSRTLSPIAGRFNKEPISPCHSPTSLEEELRRQGSVKMPQPHLKSPMKVKFEDSIASCRRNAPKPVRQASVENLPCNMTVAEAGLAAFKTLRASPKKGTVAALQRSLPTISL
mmetsp:Transcript_13943/g.26727  ORF Transcript_13943/g.26727 Transcript_13943/m.26727 type:complete len:164 (+) Transcript_13943:76-567(+)